IESFSVRTVVEILSRPAPPYSSGTPPPIKPTSPPFFTSEAINPVFLFSRSLMSGKTSLRTNSSAVWPISFWSSLKSAGVKTSPGCADSSRKLPPFAAGFVRVAVAIWVAPSGGMAANAIRSGPCLWRVALTVCFHFTPAKSWRKQRKTDRSPDGFQFVGYLCLSLKLASETNRGYNPAPSRALLRNSYEAGPLCSHSKLAHADAGRPHVRCSLRGPGSAALRLPHAPQRNTVPVHARHG